MDAGQAYGTGGRVSNGPASRIASSTVGTASLAGMRSGRGAGGACRGAEPLRHGSGLRAPRAPSANGSQAGRAGGGDLHWPDGERLLQGSRRFGTTVTPAAKCSTKRYAAVEGSLGAS